MKAVYAGSFDPLTAGHLSVIKQARICNWDEITILVAHNPDKQTGMFTAEERVDIIERVVAGMTGIFSPTAITVDKTAGLVVEYAKRHGADALIRGVRGEMDIQSEMSLAQVNKAVADIPTVFFPADAALSEVSSSEVKRMFAEGEDISMFVVPAIYEALKKKKPSTKFRGFLKQGSEVNPSAPQPAH
jgi:pantetheine-phosphate adenylyltransferase